jgi:hypothetical protein
LKTETIKTKLLEEAEQFKGDKAKFWSGHMSMGIGALLGKRLNSIGETLKLLTFFKDEYGKIIYERTQ